MSLYALTVLSDTPIAYWRLGESSGASAADSSGNGETATYYGTAGSDYQLDRAGAISGDNDGAIFLDGASGYVAPAAASYWNQTTSTGSAEAWINTSSTGTQEIVRLDQASPLNWVWLLRTNGGLLECYAVSGAAHVATAASVATATWHHCVATWSYDAGSNTTTLSLYLDGALIGTSSCTGQGASLSSAQPQLGRSLYAGGNEYLTGKIDEVAIYAHALSAARVVAHYQAGVAQGIVAEVIGVPRLSG